MRRDLAPTLHRFAGRCRPGRVMSFGTDRWEIVAATCGRFTGYGPNHSSGLASAFQGVLA